MRYILISSLRAACAAACLAAAAPSAASVTNLVLTVDEYGHVSSTNAMVTQADMAAVSASNALVQAEIEAARAGYQAAISLLSQVAASMVSTPVAFYGPELVGFDAAVAFDPDAEMNIVGWSRTSDTATKTTSGGASLLCRRWVMRFVFTESLQGVQPLLAYSTNCVNQAEWDNLDGQLVGTPVIDPVPYSEGGVTYVNTYFMDVWLPERGSGFVFVRVPNDAISGDGLILEFAGAKGGYNGEWTIGTNRLEFVNGVAYPGGSGS